MSDREAFIERDIRKRAHEVDLIVYRNPGGWDAATGTRYGLQKGAADLIGLLRGLGIFVAIEVKRKGGVLSEEQCLFLDLVEEAGGLAICATSFDDVVEAVNAVRGNRVYKWREAVGQVRGLRRALPTTGGRIRTPKK